MEWQRFCADCGQPQRGTFGLTAHQRALTIVVIIAADVVAAALTDFLALAVGVPLTFLALFLLSQPR